MTNMKQIGESFESASKAMKLVVEVSLALLESDDKVASGSYITRLKDFADRLFDVTYSDVSDEGKNIMMEQARKMNWG